MVEFVTFFSVAGSYLQGEGFFFWGGGGGGEGVRFFGVCRWRGGGRELDQKIFYLLFEKNNIKVFTPCHKMAPSFRE